MSVQLQQSEIGNFPSAWKIDRVDSAFDIQQGKQVSKRNRDGETEGGALPSNLYDNLSSIYLQPLRDPESGLRPGRNSQVSRLIDCLTPEDNPVQVLVSTHSPVLASQAPIDSVISVHESEGKVTGVSLCTIDYDETHKRKLQRFLDATRAELFFARRILMVEGIAEALLLPVLTRIAGGNLKDSSVTVLNADGINFNAFIPLFGIGRLGISVAILTDGDDADRTGKPSATASGLKAKEVDTPNLRVEFGEITFEHELARSSVLLPFMIEAFRQLRPTLGITLRTSLAGLHATDEKADAFLAEFLRSETSKGEFAQELAGILDDSLEAQRTATGPFSWIFSQTEAEVLSSDDVPQYIRNALVFLGVIKK